MAIRARADGFTSIVQAIPAAQTDFVKDLRLRRPRVVTAGQSLTVAIESDSSLCFDFDSSLNFTDLCEEVQIFTPESGILTVTALAGGEPFPIESNYAGTLPQRLSSGKVTIPVAAGVTYYIRVFISFGYAPQRVEVTTALQH